MKRTRTHPNAETIGKKLKTFDPHTNTRGADKYAKLKITYVKPTKYSYK